MNDWNKNYKPYSNTNYGYGYKEESLWFPLLVLFGIIGLPILAYWGYNLWKYLRSMYDVGQIVGCAVAGTILFFVASIVVWSIGAALLAWWDGIFDGWFGTTYKAPINSYNNGNLANNTANIVKPAKPAKAWVYKAVKPILYSGDRRCPPRAEMFGRLDGETIEALGKYEERWLSYREYDWWLTQNERKQALEARLLDETVQKDPIVLNTSTKIEY